MSEPAQAPMLDDQDFARLTYGERLSLSLALSKSYGPAIGLLVLAGCALLLGAGGALFSLTGLSLETLQGDSPGLPADGFAVFFLAAVLSQFLMVGLNRLLLFLSEGRQPEGGFFAAVLSPWTRFNAVLSSILLWLLLTVAYQMVFGFLGRLPGLGPALELAASLVLSVVTNCAMLHIAARLDDLTPLESVTGPLRIISRTFFIWLGAMATLVLCYLPGLLLTAAGGGLLLTGRAEGLWLWGILGAGLAAVLTAVVFGLFFLAVTYRHTRGRILEREA